jgi:TRAP-type mannitol/chloroaromatic compound transport system permease large subunit
MIGREMPAAGDEVVIMSITVASLLALALAIFNRVTRMGLLSRLAEQVTFVLIPPLVLIFLVLGTIFLGIATPTEGGAMGALGALIMAASRGRLSFDLMKQAGENTTKLAIFVLSILIGSTVFSFTFNAADGHIWVEHLFDKLPGGALGFLIIVNLLVFVLGMFIDFFEIAFIVVPILAPVAAKVLPELLPEGTPPEMALIWFGIILAMNLQTSFLTPPFGFALFYLRSVAARSDYTDQITKQRIPAVTTAQIYKGSIAFIILQLIMVAAVIAYPKLVVGNLEAAVKVDDATVTDMLNNMPGQEEEQQQDPTQGMEGADKPAGADGAAPKEEEELDPAKALEEELKSEKKGQ